MPSKVGLITLLIILLNNSELIRHIKCPSQKKYYHMFPEYHEIILKLLLLSNKQSKCVGCIRLLIVTHFDGQDLKTSVITYCVCQGRNEITGVCLFIYLSVCLWAQLHQNHWTDFAKF